MRKQRLMHFRRQNISVTFFLSFYIIFYSSVIEEFKIIETNFKFMEILKENTITRPYEFTCTCCGKIIKPPNISEVTIQ